LSASPNTPAAQEIHPALPKYTFLCFLSPPAEFPDKNSPFRKFISDHPESAPVLS
jgi:hypothetical protein